VGRRAAEEEVDREYSASRKLEYAFTKKWKGPKWVNDNAEATRVSNRLCEALGVRPLKGVVKGSFKGIMRHAEAFYRQREIHVRGSGPTDGGGMLLVTLLHELAHHVCYMEGMHRGGAHGEDFLTVEQLLFDLVLENRSLVDPDFS